MSIENDQFVSSLLEHRQRLMNAIAAIDSTIECFEAFEISEVIDKPQKHDKFKLQNKIYSFFVSNPNKDLSMKEIVHQLSEINIELTRLEVRPILLKLIESNKVEQIGSRNRALYKLKAA